MALGNALDSALSGLRVAQQQINTISNNVANVSTPGYTRKVLPQSTQNLESTGQTIGVRADILIRNVDLKLLTDVWTQVSTTASKSVEIDYLSRIEDFHGPPDAEISISAELAELKNNFSALSDTPEDSFQLERTVAQAEVVADRVQSYATLLRQLRNDAEDQITESINEMNDLLSTIADLNGDIRAAVGLERSSADLEDQRDDAIKRLSEIVEVSTFVRGDGVMVVQTSEGFQLADESVTDIFYDSTVMTPSTYYPDSIEGIFIGGDPATNPAAFDITTFDLNGELGKLIELRDETLLQYSAQLDEFAYRMATRFDAQGVQLFTNSAGTIPADTAPDPTTDPVVAVDYVGFAEDFQVNQAIQADNTLLRTGTYTSDVPVVDGSNEVIQRILDYTFGDVEYVQAGSNPDQFAIDIRTGVGNGTTLQDVLGVTSTNEFVFGRDIRQYADITTMVADSGTILSDPLSDDFNIRFYDADLGFDTGLINIDMDAVNLAQPIGGAITNAAEQIVAFINNDVPAALAPATDFADLDVVASVNSFGQIVINTRGDIDLDSGTMGDDGLSFLGLAAGTYEAEDPYFEVEVGNRPAVRITIDPDDTSADLVDKLTYDSVAGTGVPGLEVDLDAATGVLTLRPGGDDTNGGPNYGGGMRIVSGPFTASSAGNAAILDGVNLVSALFGSFDATGEDLPATFENDYQSEISNGSGTFVPFRTEFLGPAANIETEIISGQNILDFAQKMINTQTQDLVLAQLSLEDEQVFQSTLERKLQDDSGVNLDEELSNLIVVQNAYSAAAQTMTTIRQLFDQLLTIL